MIRKAPLGISVSALVAVAVSLSAQPARHAAPAAFADVTGKAGITFVHASGTTPDKHMYETFGSGVASPHPSPPSAVVTRTSTVATSGYVA